MIYAKDTRYGLDAKMHLLQRYVNNKINASVYPVLEENEKQAGKVLEWKEKEVFVDDRETVIIGFRLIGKAVNSLKITATVDCIVSAKDTDTEYIEAKVFKILINSGFVNEITGYKNGVSETFTGLQNDNIKYRDIKPYHVFAFTFEISYENDICL